MKAIFSSHLSNIFCVCLFSWTLIFFIFLLQKAMILIIHMMTFYVLAGNRFHTFDYLACDFFTLRIRAQKNCLAFFALQTVSFFL